jgi:hypothetical protein
MGAEGMGSLFTKGNSQKYWLTDLKPFKIICNVRPRVFRNENTLSKNTFKL